MSSRSRGSGFLLSLLAISLFLPEWLQAQQAISVSVTPPLFQLSIGPGETWSSTLKVVNANTFPVTYYANVSDFEANGEDGSSKFIPLLNATSDPREIGFSLGSWIELPQKQVTVPGSSSADLPFTIRVPQNAEPGGHYAAILVGTQPPPVQGVSELKVSSYISSLLIVRIKGEAIEKARIREFSSQNSLYQTPDASFALRVENIGTTHVRPQGDITIYNMWGRVRGTVPINQKSNFGNVLPNSIRKFQFSWRGETNAFDIGRYRALVTLSYGEDGKQNISATTYFWIVPLVPVSISLGILVLFILLITWFIRRYIRRALALEQARLGYVSGAKAPREVPAIATLMEPIKEGVIDLRKLRFQGAPAQEGSPAGGAVTVPSLFKKYRLFLAFLLIIAIAGVSAYAYLGKVLVPKRTFQITDVQINEEPAPQNQ